MCERWTDPFKKRLGTQRSNFSGHIFVMQEWKNWLEFRTKGLKGLKIFFSHRQIILTRDPHCLDRFYNPIQNWKYLLKPLAKKKTAVKEKISSLKTLIWVKNHFLFVRNLKVSRKACVFFTQNKLLLNFNLKSIRIPSKNTLNFFLAVCRARNNIAKLNFILIS